MSETKQVGAPGGEQEFVDADRAVDLSTEQSDRGLAEVDAEAEGRADERAQQEIHLDVIFDILKNQRRRHVLRFLRENHATTLSDLAEHVAALENDKDVQSLTSSERKRVYVGLYQCHLPRMSDAGVIDFDSDRGKIELNETAEFLEPYLDVHDEGNRPWALYHLGLALGGGALYALSVLLFGAEAMPALLVVPLLVLAISATALVEFRSLAADDDDR